MSKKPFLVGVREVHVSHRRVFADSAKEARDLYVNGIDEGDEVFCEYSHTLDPEFFTVEPETCDPDNGGLAHELDWSTATPADGAPGIMDVTCSRCGCSGSFRVNPDEVNW